MFTNEQTIAQDRLLLFLRDRSFTTSQDLLSLCEQHSLDLTSSTDQTPLLHLIEKILAGIPEASYLEALLQDPAFSLEITSESVLNAPHKTVISAFLPIPGMEDATPLAASPLSPEFHETVPFIAQRTYGWIVLTPQPRVIVVTYHPDSLGVLEASTPFWVKCACRIRPDLADALRRPGGVVLGLCTPHQLLTPVAHWKRTPVPADMRAIVEEAGMDPFLSTDLAVYCWHDPAKTPSHRTLRDLRNRIFRHVVCRPRMYPAHLGGHMLPFQPPSIRMMTPGAQQWRDRFVSMVEDAAGARDSDLHFLPSINGGIHVLRRRSGHLQWTYGIPPSASLTFLNAVLAGTDLNLEREPSVPKDARLSIHLPTLQRRIDVRVAINPGAPPHRVPAMILRLLDPAAIQGGLPHVLIDDYDRGMWEHALGLTSGLVLVTGPTGSGKSHTLYSALQTLHQRHPERSYKSVEDPIELQVGDWLQQNQVNHATGASFSAHLRSMLRSDPEVLFVGEIRDAETADIAYQGALSGHLIIASIHVDTLSQIPDRFAELGINPTKLRSVLRFATAQRLVGRSCPHCREITSSPAHILSNPSLLQTLQAEFGSSLDSTRFIVNSGCPHCHDIGVKGRFAVQEYLVTEPTDVDMMTAIAAADPFRIREIQRERKVPSLRVRALRLALADPGATNIDECADL